jgi:glycosyltransferase involved in cell wall biosynthesis
MDTNYLISICIPAYKRVDFLERLLESIAIQSFKSFEVIVTDDSPDESVAALCRQYQQRLPALKYFRNESTAGTPANWNRAISHASGKWIKLMHDDDWFSGQDALEKFASYAEKNDSDFLFCDYINVEMETGRETLVYPSKYRLKQLERCTPTLLYRNIIGPPSVVMHRNDKLIRYDEELKWLVDIEMYIRTLKTNRLSWISAPLIKVGVGKEQVTAFTHGVPEVEIPEHFHFLRKHGLSMFRNYWVYDYWWRLLRNFKLKKPEDIIRYARTVEIPMILLRMMRCQSRFPDWLLRRGVFSKTGSMLHFLFHRNSIKD